MCADETTGGDADPREAETVFDAPGAAPGEKNAAAEVPLGQKIGAYTVVEQISSGGFGRVLRAHRVEPVAHDVAIKTLRPDRGAEEFAQLFEAERRVLASLEHPNIARFIDAGTTEAGAPYLVMEYVRGEPMTVFARINRLTLRDRARLVAQACRGAHHAHEMGLVHRDIKPDNLLVSYVGGEPSVKIVDFGLAHLLGPSAAFEHDSGSRASAGTPGYLSPEQDGRTRLNIDRRADVWALAATMHTLAVGRPPTPVRDQGDGRATEFLSMAATLEGIPDAERLAGERRGTPGALLSDVRSLDEVVGPALDPDRQRRPATALELGQALEAWAGGRGEGNHARAGATDRSRGAEPSSKGPLIPVLIGVGLIIVLGAAVGIAGVVWWASSGDSPPEEPVPIVSSTTAAGADPIEGGDIAAPEPATPEGATDDRDAPVLSDGSDADGGGAEAGDEPEAPASPDVLTRVRQGVPLELAEVRLVGAEPVVSGPVINADEVETAGRRLAALGVGAVNELRPDASAVRRELLRRIREAEIVGLEVSVRNQNETFGPTYIFVRVGVDAPDDAAARVAELARGLCLDASLIRTTD